MNRIGISVAVVVLAGFAPGAGADATAYDVMSVGSAAEAAPPTMTLRAAMPPGAPSAAGVAPPDCWIGHTQVQPFRLRATLGGEAVGAMRDQLAVDEHLGAEHLVHARMRPCNAAP